MELVVDLPRPQRFQQVAPHLLRELAGVNRDVGNGRHLLVFAELARQDKFSRRRVARSLACPGLKLSQ